MTSKRSAATLLVLSLLLASCSGKEAATGPAATAGETVTASPSPSAVTSRSMDHRKKRQELSTFIAKQLTGPYGVYTNLLETDQSGEAATGHEVLSESASLLMSAAALAGDKEQFAGQWALAQQTFDMEGGFSYRYSPKQQKRYPVNAAVDDLRLIGALYEAGEVFDEPAYTEQADKYGQRFYDNNVKEGYMYDFYDNVYKTTNNFVTLCYIDLGILRKLSISSELSGILMHNMDGILEEGYLSDTFPFYETRFDYHTGAYSSDHINTVESLLSILHLTETGQQKPASIRYIKEQVAAGTLYGQYSRDGKPLNDIRSTAIYALAAMIGAEAGDDSLYQAAIARMNEFQIRDADSPLSGGFGNTDTGQAYSFDNLMALLAYSYSL
ncbi:hypothetical protein AMQ84_30660 [Paenibacillus riograndensis]|uniref:Glycosyl hydrolase n=1 Tax=Paenibacillus riograndensis TaxID=483937 RepID=A0A132TDJ6_9BACL|nr:hypothetical protein [Paenibacillus riograndensis]KWX69361.1 hypothetical protein AMQ84_30660 [Paenibacillus riograndensis]